MKNKLKRIQLKMRYTSRNLTIFVSVFALTLSSLSIALPKLSTYAEPGDTEELFEADARIDAPVPGDTPASMSIGSSEPEKYAVSIDYWYLSEGDNPELNSDSVFEEHKDYALRFTFQANEGYAFREDTVFTVNGQATTRYGNNNQREFIFQDITNNPEGPGNTNTYVFKKVSSRTEEVSWDTDLTDYINNKRNEWSNSEEGQNVNGDYREGWENLYVTEDGVYKYPIYSHTYFEGVVIDPTCDNTILVGDPDEIIGGCATYQYRIEYEEVTVTKPSYTVKFDDGGILSDRDKLVDQTVLAGESPEVPWNAEGTTLFDMLGYCYISEEYNCYNNYYFEGVYKDPEFNNPYTDDDVITENTTLYANWIDEFEGSERIKEINMSMVLPAPGTEIVITDEEDRWDSQKPQLEVTLPSGLKYHLWDDNGEDNYAYWLKGNAPEDYKPFTGIIEKGGKYYVEIWFQINEDEMAIFDEGLTLKIDGVETPFEFTDYSPDGVALMIEINIPGDDEEESAFAPETGAFTALGDSASLAISFGAIAMATISTLAFAVAIIRKR